MAGVVQNPKNTNFNLNVNAAGDQYGRQGDKQVSEVHGRYWSAAIGGNLFMTVSVAAVTLPVTGATLASKWCLVNPVSSGVNMELLWADVFVNSATQVVNVIQMSKPVTVATAGLGTLTQGIIAPAVFSPGTQAAATTNGGSQAIYYTAATHTDTPVVGKGLVNIEATAIGLFANRYNFEGAVVIPPGTVIDLLAGTGAQANFWADMAWAEWPL